jgi:hypothetical protein
LVELKPATPYLSSIADASEQPMDQNPGDARQTPMVRSSLVEEAKSQGIDIVLAAEAGIARAVSRAADRET